MQSLAHDTNSITAMASTSTARIPPPPLPLHAHDMSLPVDGGVWVKQQPQQQPDQRRLDPAQADLDDDQQQQQHQLRQPPSHQHNTSSSNNDAAVYPYAPSNMDSHSSSSDLTSPLTPTFSHHGSAHLRYASSTSSLDLQQSFSPIPPCADSPASPTAQPPVQSQQHAAGSTSSAASSTKRQLPDVQEEEPLERDDADADLPSMPRLTAYQLDSLYDCLCDSPCIHQNSDLVHSAEWARSETDIGHFDYDMGFLSDGDTEVNNKLRNGADSSLSGLTMRLAGSRFPTLNRWRSTKRRNRAFTAASEASLDMPPSLSRATSTSRSSSLSAPSRKLPDRSNEPPLPPTPVLSFYEYESTESVVSAVVIDVDRPDVRDSIERERAMATTPLLPPLLTEPPVSSVNQSLQPSPLQSPTVAPQPSPEIASPVSYAAPSLSTKPSIASFRPPLLTSLSSPVVATSEVVCTIPNLLEQHDAWSDRLGHANYTILPRPYRPDTLELDALRTLRADWDLARINYTKHIVRTGEHYGTTSKTYALTEAKWAETEREWKSAHDDLVQQLALLNPGNEAQLRWDRLQDDAATTVPRMLDAEGKFPDLGDEDIVGPMVRDAVMARDAGSDADTSAKKFWKTLAGRVGLRK